MGIVIMVSACCLFFIAIAEFIYAAQLGTNETLAFMVNILFNLDEKTGKTMDKLGDKGVNPFQAIGSLFAGLTIFATLWACVLAMCATPKCHNKICAVIFIIVSSLFFLGLAIGLLAAGSVMTFPVNSGFLE